MNDDVDRLLAALDPRQKRKGALQRLPAAALVVFKCYGEVLQMLSGDAALASGLFEVIAKSGRKHLVPRKGRGPGKKYAERDRQLVAARRAAPKGQIEAAIAGVSGGETHDNAARHARRLTERDRKRDQTIERFGTAIGDALRNGDGAKACKLLLEELPKALGTPDK